VWGEEEEEEEKKRIKDLSTLTLALCLSYPMPPGTTLIKEEYSSSFFLSFSLFFLLLLYLPEAILPLGCQKRRKRKMVELDDEKESGGKTGGRCREEKRAPMECVYVRTRYSILLHLDTVRSQQ
jgi:hypothetical protein